MPAGTDELLTGEEVAMRAREAQQRFLAGLGNAQLERLEYANWIFMSEETNPGMLGNLPPRESVTWLNARRTQALKIPIQSLKAPKDEGEKDGYLTLINEVQKI